MNGLSNLLQNKLLLQYLAGAGADIASGQPIGQNVSAITQQNIAAQNMMGLLAKMLAGKVPEGGKITIDDKGTKIQVPNNVQSETSATVQNDMLRDMISGSRMAGGSHIDWTKQENINKLSVLRPFFGQPSNIAPEDLAGLTTADISQALQGALSVEGLKSKRFNDIVNALYKQKLMNYYDALITKAQTPEVDPLDKPFIGNLTLRQFKALPSDAQEYALAKFGAKVLGDNKFMTKREWESMKKPERIRFLEGLKEHPELMKIEEALRKAGAPTIAEITGRKEALADLAGELYFKDPGWIDDVGRHLNSAPIRMNIDLSNDERAAAREAAIYIENKIHAGRGKIEDVKISEDGRTIIWTVRWPSGNKQEIRYGFGS